MFRGYTFRSRRGERFLIGRAQDRGASKGAGELDFDPEPLPDAEAAFVLRTLAPTGVSGSPELRRFWKEYDSAVFARNLNRATDQQLFQALLRQISGPSGRLRVYRAKQPGEKSAGGGATVPEAKPEVKQVAARVMAGKRNIPFDGRAYRVLTNSEWQSAPGPDRKELVAIPVPEAQALLTRMAASPHAAASEKSALEQALPLLADGGGKNPPSLVLLQWVPRTDPMSPRGAEAVTPAQMKQQKPVEEDWIEVELVYSDGAPFTGQVEIALADGRKVKTTADEKGILHLDNIPPGQCQLKLPDRDGAAWS
jgi:hypothetical protein